MNSEVTSPWIEEARQIAAQCWCHETTAGTEMDVVLAERVAVAVAAWMDTAAQAQRNTDYYRSLVVEIGEAIGQAAYVADDGGVSDSVLCAKVPELVRQLLTTPPASGEVVGVPREPTMGRGSMMDAGVAAARSHKEAKDIDPTFGMVRAIYAAMLSAAPKQAMGWLPDDLPPVKQGDSLLGR